MQKGHSSLIRTQPSHQNTLCSSKWQARYVTLITQSCIIELTKHRSLIGNAATKRLEAKMVARRYLKIDVSPKAEEDRML